MNTIYKHIRNNIFYYLIYTLFLIEMLINIESKYLSGDESFTYNMINHSFLTIIKLTSQDVHPFLYYFIGKTFTYNLNNMYLKIFILRLVSALPYLILLIISNTYIKKKLSKITSVIFMFCIVSMPLLIDNIYIVRMYGWAVLFTTITYILLRSSYKSNNNLKNSIFASLFSILSAYTHYYALLIIIIIYFLFLILFIIKKKNIKYLILSIVINIVLYLPWLKILLNQTTNASKDFWTSKFQLKAIIHMLIGDISPIYKPSLLYIFPLLFFIALMIIMFNKNIRIDGINIIGILIPPILIMLGSFISIIIGHSVVMIRYITPAMGIFWLAISIMIDDIGYKNKIIKYIIIPLILIIGLLSYVQNNNSNINITNKFNKTLKIYNNIPKDSAIIYDNADVMSSAINYLNNNYSLDDTNILIYKKTFNHFHQLNKSFLPRSYKHIFYMSSNEENTRLIGQFSKKYKSKNREEIYLPLDSNKIYVYKIK